MFRIFRYLLPASILSLFISLSYDKKSIALNEKVLCGKKIQLFNIQDFDIGKNNIFFIETSPKENLTSREACALESAARNSELIVHMVRVSPFLDLKDNTTCEIYKRYKGSGLIEKKKMCEYSQKFFQLKVY